MTDQTSSIEAIPVAPPVVREHSSETTLSEYLESLLVTVLLALFLTTFVVQAFKIPSASMEGTLLIGDHVLVNKFIFGGSGAWFEKLLPYRDLQRGDIIVFKYPYADHQHYVKRVIGLPGDHLKLEDQRVFINGKLLNEPYVIHDPAVGYDPLNYNFPPWVLRCTPPKWSRSGLIPCRAIPAPAKSLSPPASISPWATIVITVWTAVTGASWIAPPSWDALS